MVQPKARKAPTPMRTPPKTPKRNSLKLGMLILKSPPSRAEMRAPKRKDQFIRAVNCHRGL